MYLEGNDAVEADNATAFRWFQRAADQGSPVGQSGLGLMYLTGRGLPKDPEKAVKYFTLASEQGQWRMSRSEILRIICIDFIFRLGGWTTSFGEHVYERNRS